MKFCNVTFVPEGQLQPDGTALKLLRCSRCQDCFYRGKEEQRKHWKVHKKVCQPAPEVSPLADKQRFDEMNMDEAGAELLMLFTHKKYDAGPVWVLLMQRVCHLFRTSDYRSRMFDATVSGTLPAMACNLASLSNRDMELLWATPGMANFLLSSVDLTSDHMRQKREGGAALSAEELTSYQFNPEIHTHDGFATFFGAWIMSSIQYGSFGNVNQRAVPWQYRKTGFAKAAAHCLALWWKDPYTRASLSLWKDHHTSNRQEWMPLAIMTSIDQCPIDDANPSEIAPGLTVKDAAMTIARECYVYTGLRLSEMVNCLVESYGFEQEAWRHFSAEDRAECALVVVERMFVKESPEASKEWCFRGSMNLGVELILALTGLDTRSHKVKDSNLRLKVLQLASRNRRMKPGCENPENPQRLHAPDYFGLCLDKIIEAHRPQLDALSEAIKPHNIDFPCELLTYIAQFICEPFSEDSRDGVELTYLLGFVTI